jgi:hypothetical protein
MAPMDAGYNWLNTTPYINVWNDSLTTQSATFASFSASHLTNYCYSFSLFSSQTNGMAQLIKSL